MLIKVLRIILFLFSNALLFVSAAIAIQLDAKVQTDVEFSGDTGIYRYQYSVINKPNNTSSIYSIEIDTVKPAGSMGLSTQGLSIIERSGTQASYDDFWTLKLLQFPNWHDLVQPMVPVGFRPPDQWTAGLTVTAAVSWSAILPFGNTSQNVIHPGETKSGFELTSYGPPGIRIAKLYVPAPLLSPLQDTHQTTPPDQMTAAQESAILKNVLDQTALHLTTIGPTAPPQNFIPLDFINYLISLRRQAETHLWITQPSMIPALDAKLNLVKASLTANNNAAAITDLNDFINEVENKKKVALTSEAYILLKFNALYLREKLLRSK